MRRAGSRRSEPPNRDGWASSPAAARPTSSEADRDRRLRVPRLRRDQPRAAAPNCSSTPPTARSSATCSTRPRRSAPRPSGDRSTWPPGSSRGPSRRSAASPQDVATIVAMELAQLRLLEEFFEVAIGREARLSFGYSIGELSAMVLGGVLPLEQLLPVPLGLAADCAELAGRHDHGRPLHRGARPAARGRRAALPGGQQRGARADRPLGLPVAQHGAADRPGGHARPARARDGRVPAREGDAPAQAAPLAAAAHAAGLAEEHPQPDRRWPSTRSAGASRSRRRRSSRASPGEASYDELNSREILIQWTDHPQRLWDVIDETLGSGVELVVHVGPAPNLIPATFGAG